MEKKHSKTPLTEDEAIGIFERLSDYTHLKWVLVVVLAFVLWNPATQILDMVRKNLYEAVSTETIPERIKPDLARLIAATPNFLSPDEACAADLGDMLKRVGQDNAATANKIAQKEQDNIRSEQKIKKIQQRNIELKLELIQLEKDYNKLVQDNEKKLVLSPQQIEILETMLKINKKRTYLNNVYLKWENASKTEISTAIDYAKYILQNLYVYTPEKQEKYKPTLEEILKDLKSIK